MSAEATESLAADDVMVEGGTLWRGIERRRG
jgi:hypothetical protein